MISKSRLPLIRRLLVCFLILALISAPVNKSFLVPRVFAAGPCPTCEGEKEEMEKRWQSVLRCQEYVRVAKEGLESAEKRFSEANGYKAYLNLQVEVALAAIGSIGGMIGTVASEIAMVKAAIEEAKKGGIWAVARVVTLKVALMTLLAILAALNAELAAAMVALALAESVLEAFVGYGGEWWAARIEYKGAVENLEGYKELLAKAESEYADAQKAYDDCVAGQETCDVCEKCEKTGCEPIPCPEGEECQGGICVSTQGEGALLPPTFPEDSTLVSVSPDGSILSTDDGLTIVIFPAGAVSDPATVVYMPQPRIPINGFDVVRLLSLEAYSGCCEWQKFTDFNKPVTIQVSYTREEVAGIDEEQLGLYYFDNELNEWVALEAVVDPAGDSVTVNELNYFTLHFTLYALMAPAEAAAD